MPSRTFMPKAPNSKRISPHNSSRNSKSSKTTSWKQKMTTNRSLTPSNSNAAWTSNTTRSQPQKILARTKKRRARTVAKSSPKRSKLIRKMDRQTNRLMTARQSRRRVTKIKTMKKKVVRWKVEVARRDLNHKNRSKTLKFQGYSSLTMFISLRELRGILLNSKVIMRVTVLQMRQKKLRVVGKTILKERINKIIQKYDRLRKNYRKNKMITKWITKMIKLNKIKFRVIW